MNPIPADAMAFAMNGAMFPFDATPLFDGLLVLLAAGALILICAAWSSRPRRAAPRFEASPELIAEPPRTGVGPQSSRRGARRWPAIAISIRGAVIVRRAAGGAR